MKILLDTNIIIHRETKGPINKDIGTLFWWIGKLRYQKCIHQVTVNEISSNQDLEAREAFLVKLKSYNCLPTVAPLRPEVQQISQKYDKTENDRNDSLLLNEVLSGRVDLLVTEDRSVHVKALELGIDSRVFTIDEFLEKVTTENPDQLDYVVPSVKKEYFGNIDLKDPFFDSFKDEYPDFEAWFNRKSDEMAYVCRSGQTIVAFLYLKLEGPSEPYYDITPTFASGKRLKIGSFKVQSNGFKLGERLLKIVFDNALHLSVDVIYVTLFEKRVEHFRLIELLKEFGFGYWGIKESVAGKESVYLRDFSPVASEAFPRKTFPFMSGRARKFIVPIHPEYHTNLFPGSILRTESPTDFADNEPFRNAISKVYVSRSVNRSLKSGDVIVFYRTGERTPRYYSSVVTTLGIVESVNTSATDSNSFISLCRKRSVYSEEELRRQWDTSPPGSKPFAVKFLYAYSFPKRINMKRLIELGVLRDVYSAPRGFEEMSDQSFRKIIKETNSDERIVVY
jgi:predicted nucleic acid-binding protein